MTQRYGQINLSLDKVKRIFVKKAVPEGTLYRHLSSHALLTVDLQTITHIFYVTPQIWQAFLETRYLWIKYVACVSSYTSSTYY